MRFDHVRKEFPGVIALKDISFSVKKGEVHALLGENGAGKSTLLNILHGVFTATSGQVLLDGKSANYSSPYEAIARGVIKVHQEVQVVENLNVAQNIALGFEKTKAGILDYREINTKVDEILKELGCTYKSSDPVTGLGVGDLQMMAIAKSLYHNADVISLDEPTSALSTMEIEKLFEIVKRLKQKGLTIIFISHKLDEIFEIADRITILRDGEYIATKNKEDTDKAELIRMMVGRDVSEYAVRMQPSKADYSKVVLEVRDLCGKTFRNISFKVYKGEILGFAGLVGARRTEVMRAIFGIDPLYKGEIYFNGRKVVNKKPEDALKNGIGLISEDRKREGYIPSMDNCMNMNMAVLGRFQKNGFLDYPGILKNFENYADSVHLNIKNPEHLTRNLSGGNQQKVIVAKWLATNVDLLIFDEPTKGVDVGAKSEIYKLMEEFVALGKTIVMVSSEMTEVIGMSDRIIIMREGSITGELTNKNEFSGELILAHAMEEVE
ncbi:MAG: sugar ABC transporter ATP-binding protein [Clostridiales bacterium]|nr:sugar ABC transporter ATP-binding protein [Clostridiales bacterium]